MRRIAHVALVALVFVTPWEDSAVIPAIGTLSKIVGLIAAVLYLLSLVAAGGSRRAGPFQFAMVTFVGWATASLFWTADVDAGMAKVLTFAQLCVMTWMIWDLDRSESAHRDLLQAYVVGAYMSVIGTFIAYATGAAFSTNRYAAAGFDPNYLGIALVIGVPFAAQLTYEDTGRVRGLINAAYPAFATIAVVLTASRTSIIALGITLLALPSVFRRSPMSRRVLLICGVGVLAFGVEAVVPSGALARLETLSMVLQNRSVGGRADIWHAGREIVEDHPIFGIGVGSFARVAGTKIGDPMVAHNTFLSITAEEGAIGTIVFLWMLFLAAKYVRALPRGEALTHALALAALVIGMLTLTMEHKKVVWLTLAIVVSAGARDQDGHRGPVEGQARPGVR